MYILYDPTQHNYGPLPTNDTSACGWRGRAVSLPYKGQKTEKIRIIPRTTLQNENTTIYSQSHNRDGRVCFRVHVGDPDLSGVVSVT